MPEMEKVGTIRRKGKMEERFREGTRGFKVR